MFLPIKFSVNVLITSSFCGIEQLFKIIGGQDLVLVVSRICALLPVLNIVWVCQNDASGYFWIDARSQESSVFREGSCSNVRCEQ